MSYIHINPVQPPRGARTLRWEVVDLQGNLLGRVMWYSSWRQYTFCPVFPTAFEEDCLREIAAFVEDRTKEHRA